MNASVFHLDSNYISFLDNIKTKLQQAQTRAALAVNKELILVYWSLGKELVAKQSQFKWGSQVLKQFSHDMQQAFPQMQGLSVSNLERMKKFALEYPELSIPAQAVRELPWGHIITLIHKVKDKIHRDWYAQKAIENGWSRSILEMQIETDLYSRQALATEKTTNFEKHLPIEQSQRALEILKDPYNFDFLTLSGKAHERDIENALIKHVRDFLIELGQGFAYVGSQVPLNIDDQEFFIDLLFYPQVPKDSDINVGDVRYSLRNTRNMVSVGFEYTF